MNNGQVICEWCERGDKPEFLDADGVKSSISGNSGKLCHALDDSWWECRKFTTSGVSVVAVNVEDFRRELARRIAEDDESKWRVEDLFEKLGLEGKTDTSCQLSHAGIDKIASVAVEIIDADWSHLQSESEDENEIGKEAFKTDAPLSEAELRGELNLDEVKQKIQELPEDELKRNVCNLFEEVYGENPAPKPPLGAKPKEVWRDARRQELAKAIFDRISFEMTYPEYVRNPELLLKWLNELQQDFVMKELNDRPRLFITNAVAVPENSNLRLSFTPNISTDYLDERNLRECKNCAMCEFRFRGNLPETTDFSLLPFCTGFHKAEFFREETGIKILVDEKARMTVNLDPQILAQKIQCGDCRHYFHLSDPKFNLPAMRCRKCESKKNENSVAAFDDEQAKSW